MKRFFSLQPIRGTLLAYRPKNNHLRLTKKNIRNMINRVIYAVFSYLIPRYRLVGQIGQTAMRRLSFTRHERKVQVVAWFAIRIQHDNVEYASAYEIARGLNLTASTHFKGILNEMVSSGELHARDRIRTGRWDGCEYMLAPGSYSRPTKRSVSVRSAGRTIGQLELF